MKNKSLWDMRPTQKMWAGIWLAQALIILLFYFLIENWAYYFLGPFFLYNVVIYLFPYWQVSRYTEERYKGAEVQRWQFILKQTFEGTQPVQAELQVLETNSANLLVLAHRHRLWILASRTSLETFSPAEAALLFAEIKKLYVKGHLHAATLKAAVQTTLPIPLWPHNRGTELVFYADNNSPDWTRLAFRLFHWLDANRRPAPSGLMPCLMFPALTNYKENSYQSLYKFLRERLIDSLQPSAEN